MPGPGANLYKQPRKCECGYTTLSRACYCVHRKKCSYHQPTRPPPPTDPEPAGPEPAGPEPAGGECAADEAEAQTCAGLRSEITRLMTHVSHLETKCVGMETELVEMRKTKRARPGGRASSCTPAPPLVAPPPSSPPVAGVMHPFGTEPILVPDDAKSTDTLLGTPAAAVEELLVRTYTHSRLNRNITCSNRKATFYK
eukprot:3334011-Pleurochrysis_carterae.AAC.1